MAKRERRRWSKAEKLEILGQFRKSGLSQREFARTLSIHASLPGKWDSHSSELL